MARREADAGASMLRNVLHRMNVMFFHRVKHSIGSKRELELLSLLW